MFKIKTCVALCVLLLAVACQNIGENKERNSSVSDSTNQKNISSLGAVEKHDTTRKFIRTADIKFKVKNVAASTYNIEDIVRKNNGFVTYTKLESIINSSITTPVSNDSSVETAHYNVVNTITLRVPNYLLDTTLKCIANEVDYLDNRTIVAEDVALQILSNNLTQKRVVKNEKRLTEAINTKAKKLAETSNAESVLLGKEEEADNAYIKNLSLTDQVNYSTVTLYLYQREAIKREFIANEKNISAYEQSFGSKVFYELKTGWKVMENLILLIIKLWAVILLGLMVLFLYKKNKHRFTNSSSK